MGLLFYFFILFFCRLTNQLNELIISASGESSFSQHIKTADTSYTKE